MPTQSRKYILAKRPVGMVKESDFEHKEETLRDINDGEILAKLVWVSFDPAQRGWMNEAPTYRPPIKLGETVDSLGVVEVVESKNEHYKKGDLLNGMVGWQEYWIFTAEDLKKLRKLPQGVPANVSLNVCGGVGLTAYFGLLNVGALKDGETVLVSGAAGATGAIVGQIAKLKGCKVIGIAGGPQKTKFLLDELGFDAAIDYKTEDLNKRLKELAPKGVDVYFDNVGGELLEPAIGNMAFKGRIVMCGSISAYNAQQRPQGPSNLFFVTTKRLRLEGFIVFDFASEYATAFEQLGGWLKEGKIKNIEDVQEGWENIPKTFLRLFQGENLGKQLLKL